MSIGSSPPQLPPQISPDGKWVWDGGRWQPLAPVPMGTMEVALPPVGRVLAERRIQAPSGPMAMPNPSRRVPAPVAQFSFPDPEPSAAPLWAQPARKGVSVYFYFVGGAVLLVMAMMVLSSLNIFTFPWSSSPTAAPTAPTPALPALKTRSESARAGSFINQALGPALGSLNQTLPDLKSCNGTLSNSCFAAVTATDQQLKQVMSVIDHTDIAPCIATPTARYRNDLSGMDADMQIALRGYHDSHVTDVSLGVARFRKLVLHLVGDGSAMDLAWKAQCDTQPTGP